MDVQHLTKWSGNWYPGYKEFDDYLTALESGKLDDQKLLALKEESIERMKAATRRYAKRQVQWIRNKLLPTIWNTQDTLAKLKSSLLSITPSQSIQLYLLDATGKRRFISIVWCKIVGQAP